MPSTQHPYPGFFTAGKGIRAFTGRLRHGHPHPILINAQDGRSYPLRGRSSRCSSPTTPPAERRAYAAREQARKAKTNSSTGYSSERSNSVPPRPRHTHSHRGHSKQEPEPEHLPYTHKHSTKHHRKAPKPGEPPRRHESDTESNWSTNVHVPWTTQHPYHHHHHHASHSEHVVLKAPFTCNCPECYQAAHRPVETTKEDHMPPKYFYEHHPHSFGTHPVLADHRVPCRCGFIHVEPAQEPSSRSTSPGKHQKGHRKHSSEPEEVRSHRHRRRRHRRHRHYTTDSSSDTTNDDEETSSESDAETRAGGEKVEYELPNDWRFCNECCWGHPVFYVLR